MFPAAAAETVEFHLFGMTWDGTFAAACVAALVAAFSWFFTHRQLGRLHSHQFWTARYGLAVEHMRSKNNNERDAGVTLLESLVDSREATRDDKLLAEKMLALFEREVVRGWKK